MIHYALYRFNIHNFYLRDPGFHALLETFLKKSLLTWLVPVSFRPIWMDSWLRSGYSQTFWHAKCLVFSLFPPKLIYTFCFIVRVFQRYGCRCFTFLTWSLLHRYHKRSFHPRRVAGSVGCSSKAKPCFCLHE